MPRCSRSSCTTSTIGTIRSLTAPCPGSSPAAFRVLIFFFLLFSPAPCNLRSFHRIRTSPSDFCCLTLYAIRGPYTIPMSSMYHPIPPKTPRLPGSPARPSRPSRPSRRHHPWGPDSAGLGPGPRRRGRSVRQLRHRFGPLPTHFSALCHPARAVCRVLIGDHGRLVLIGACDPTVCPICGFRHCRDVVSRDRRLSFLRIAVLTGTHQSLVRTSLTHLC